MRASCNRLLRACRLFGAFALLHATAAPADEPPLEPPVMTPFALRAEFTARLPVAVSWPVYHREPAPRVRVCALGENGFAEAFKQKLTDGSAPQIVFEPRVGRFALSTCDILYVAPSGLAVFEAMHDQIASLPIVTIGEGASFLGHGGMIAFVYPPDGLEPTRERLRFRLCVNHAEAAGIRFDPMLIELADKVDAGS